MTSPARQWPERRDFGNAAIGRVDIAVGVADHPSKTGPAVALHVRGESDPGKPGQSITSLTIYDPDVLDRLIDDLEKARDEMRLYEYQAAVVIERSTIHDATWVATMCPDARHEASGPLDAVKAHIAGTMPGGRWQQASADRWLYERALLPPF